VQAGIIDTYTDSNTRERRPYEADGLVAATARGWVQRDFAWARHSHSYVFAFPTWPVEWQQMTTLLAYADYWATGEADLAAAYMPLLVHNLRLQDRDGTGLLNCSAVTRGGCAAGRAGQGHHIVDWRPAPNRSMFAFSEHLSVTQAFALAGLGRLGSLAELLNRSALAASLAGEARSPEITRDHPFPSRARRRPCAPRWRRGCGTATALAAGATAPARRSAGAAE